MPEMVKYKFEGILEHEEGHDPNETISITVTLSILLTLTSFVVASLQVSNLMMIS
jgi:hypothetical protein